MRLEQLHYLIEIAKFQSLSTAGEQLHISQQALGAAIKSLENELEVPLLIRTPRGVKLTDEGTRLAQGANSIIADLEELVLSLKPEEQYTKRGTVSIVACYGALETFFSDSVGQMLKSNHRLTINVHEGDTKGIREALLNETADIGIISYAEVDGLPVDLADENLSLIPLFSKQLHIRVAKDSPLANYQRVSLKTALKEPVLVYQPKQWENNPICETIRNFCDDCNMIFQENFLLHYQMLASGKGISFAVEDGQYNDGEDKKIVRIPIKENIEVLSYAVVKRKRGLQPQIQYVLNYLQMVRNRAE